MSGIFGIVDIHQQETVQPALQRMAERLKLRDYFTTQSWSDTAIGVGLGQVNIGIFSADTQPVFNPDRSIAATLFGEIHNAPALRQALKADYRQEADQTDAELILNLYEEHGAKFPGLLEGTFGLAIWDGRTRRLLVANDRLGLIPHYYAHFAGKLLFTPRVAGILQDPQFERTLNLDALAEFFRFQRLLGDKTYWEGIHILPYGSLLIYEPDADHLSISHYWDFDQIPAQRSGITFEDAVEETGRLLRASVEESLRGEARMGVYLSGGLDSRTILGFASQGGNTPASITYGHPRSADVIYGRKIAQKLGSENYFFPQNDGKWLRDHVDFHLSMTEGLTSFIHAHSAITLEPGRHILDINLTGFNGDQLLGARAIDHAEPVVNAVDEYGFLAHFYQGLTHDYSWPGITEGEDKLLYTPAFSSQMRDRAFESLKRELVPYNQFSFPMRVDYFTAIHQGVRLSNLNTVYHRAYFDTRYPFCSYPLLDFVQSIPPEYRLNDKLYLAVINRQIPEVTWVPRDKNGLLITDHRAIRLVHSLGTKFQRRLKHWIQKDYQYQQIHGNPENWLRDDLGDWAAGILFDERTIERGILNPAFVRSIYDRHMSGREIWTIGKIAPLITFEMMMRRFFDA